MYSGKILVTCLTLIWFLFFMYHSYMQIQIKFVLKLFATNITLKIILQSNFEPLKRLIWELKRSRPLEDKVKERKVFELLTFTFSTFKITPRPRLPSIIIFFRFFEMHRQTRFNCQKCCRFISTGFLSNSYCRFRLDLKSSDWLRTRQKLELRCLQRQKYAAMLVFGGVNYTDYNLH